MSLLVQDGARERLHYARWQKSQGLQPTQAKGWQAPEAKVPETSVLEAKDVLPTKEGQTLLPQEPPRLQAQGALRAKMTHQVIVVVKARLEGADMGDAVRESMQTAEAAKDGPAMLRELSEPLKSAQAPVAKVIGNFILLACMIDKELDGDERKDALEYFYDMMWRTHHERIDTEEVWNGVGCLPPRTSK